MMRVTRHTVCDCDEIASARSRGRRFGRQSSADSRHLLPGEAGHRGGRAMPAASCAGCTGAGCPPPGPPPRSRPAR